MTAGPAALRYYGGKSALKRVSRWIAAHLPVNPDAVYCEPFCGMAGVLLRRHPVRREIISDLDDRLINWWRVVRDRPAELAHQLEWTHQVSRTEYNAAKADLDHSDPVRRVVAFTIVCERSMNATGDERNCWVATYSRRPAVMDTARVMTLHQRVRNLEIECLDAVPLLERLADDSAAVVYVDPPYRSSDVSPYRCTPDWQALTAALRRQAGRVAVSGFHDDFAALDWRCVGKKRLTNIYDAATRTMRSEQRTEKLWLNYDPPQSSLFD